MNHEKAWKNLYELVVEERDRFKEHSILLNTISYKIATALGKTSNGEDYYGNVEEDLEELIARIK